MPVSLARWPAAHPRFAGVERLAAAVGQGRDLEVVFDRHLSSHLIVALDAGAPVGLLRFVVQHIGPDDDLPAVRLGGAPLTEAKVLAFGVLEGARRRGGTALQTEAIAWATELGCHQLRSHSDGDRTANHQLKLRMGFAVHPELRGEDREGAYFVMPLRSDAEALEGASRRRRGA